MTRWKRKQHLRNKTGKTATAVKGALKPNSATCWTFVPMHSKNMPAFKVLAISTAVLGQILSCTPAKQGSSTSVQKDTLHDHYGVETHIPWRIMVASKGASIQEVETFLKEHGVTASVRKSSDTGSELLVECDGANTEQVWEILKGAWYRILYDVMYTPKGQWRILLNDPRVTSYDSDIYREPFEPVESSDINSLLAFLPPTFKNNKNDVWEKSALVFNEHGPASFYDVEYPSFDSANSTNIVRGNIHDYTIAGWAHWGSVIWWPRSIINDRLKLAGIDNVGKPVAQIITLNPRQYSSLAYITELDNIIAKAQANSSFGRVITKSHTAWAFSTQLQQRWEIIKTLPNIIVVNSAWNSNTSTAQREEAQNFPMFLSAAWTDWIWSKASFSDRGQRVDVYFQWQGLWWLDVAWNPISVLWTSYVSSRIGSALNVIRNALWWPSKVSSTELCERVRNLKRTQITQPDGSKKPVMHVFDVLMSFVNTMWFDNKFGIADGNINLTTYTMASQFSWMKNIKYYLVDASGNRTLIPNGIYNLTLYGVWRKSIQVEWDNDGVLGTDWKETTTTINRWLEVVASVSTFTFTGSGNYNLPANWSGGIMPPNPLPAGRTIIINGSGECILNVPQTISAGATLNVANGARFRVMGNLIRQ